MELKDFDQKMKKTFDNFSLELTGVRTGRASANLLKSIKVSNINFLHPFLTLKYRVLEKHF